MKEYSWDIIQYYEQPIELLNENVTVLNAIASKTKQERLRQKREAKRAKRGRRR